VVANMTAARGLAMASILSARAVGPARAGRSVRVRLRVRVYRGPVRHVSFRVRIPRRANGPLAVTIHGPAAPAPATANGLSSQLVVALSAGSAPSGSGSGTGPISSLDELRAAIASIPTYDGLYASVPGQAKRRVFRDPSLLITGRTTLVLLVKP
jgi:hypothetical protein